MKNCSHWQNCLVRMPMEVSVFILPTSWDCQWSCLHSVVFPTATPEQKLTWEGPVLFPCSTVQPGSRTGICTCCWDADNGSSLILCSSRKPFIQTAKILFGYSNKALFPFSCLFNFLEIFFSIFYVSMARVWYSRIRYMDEESFFL